MTDSKTPAGKQVLYYKTSTDYKNDPVGITATVTSNLAQLIEAGVDEKTAKTLVQNLNPDQNKDARIVVIQNKKGEAVRVFSGTFRTDESTVSLSLHQTVDLQKPTRTVEMGELNAINLKMDDTKIWGEGNEGGNRFFLQHHDVDRIKNAMADDNKLTQAQKVDTKVQLAGADDFNSLKIPSTPLAKTTSPTLPGKSGGFGGIA